MVGVPINHYQPLFVFHGMGIGTLSNTWLNMLLSLADTVHVCHYDIHIHPGGPGTGPWLLKNSCFAVAPARFHVGNNHEKKNIRFSVVCNPCRVLCFKTMRTIKVAFSLHRMRDLTASPVAVSKSKPVCSHLHWWLRMYLNNKPLRLPWTWERMLSGIDFFINFQ